MPFFTAPVRTEPIKGPPGPDENPRRHMLVRRMHFTTGYTVIITGAVANPLPGYVNPSVDLFVAADAGSGDLGKAVFRNGVTYEVTEVEYAILANAGYIPGGTAFTLTKVFVFAMGQPGLSDTVAPSSFALTFAMSAGVPNVGVTPAPSSMVLTYAMATAVPSGQISATISPDTFAFTFGMTDSVPVAPNATAPPSVISLTFGMTDGAAGLTTLVTLAEYLQGDGAFARARSVSIPIGNGDVEFRVDIAPDSWTPASTNALFSKRNATTGSFSMWINTDGTISLLHDSGTSLSGLNSSVATGFADGSRHSIKATLDIDNDAGGWDMAFYTADTIDGSYSQLGTTQTSGAGITAYVDVDAEVNVGVDRAGTFPFKGRIYAAEAYDGIGGTRKINFRPEAYAPDSEGNTFTIQNGGLIKPDLTFDFAMAAPTVTIADDPVVPTTVQSFTFVLDFPNVYLGTGATPSVQVFTFSMAQPIASGNPPGSSYGSYASGYPGDI